MPKTQKTEITTNRSLLILLLILCLAVAIVLLTQFHHPHRSTSAKVSPPAAPAATQSIAHQPVIDFTKLGKDNALECMMEKRKAAYGVGKGIDMIVKSNEALRVGNETVSMQEIQKKIELKEGDIVESDLSHNGKVPPEVYGIYVVRPGDNIWDIHFNMLKHYFQRRGIALEPHADEPNARGYSSGIGKLLKFSEKMVYIYDLREKRLDTNLNLIYPMSKIVIYKMNQVFRLLDKIDYSRVRKIQFDGENHWIPND